MLSKLAKTSALKTFVLHGGYETFCQYIMNSTSESLKYVLVNMAAKASVLSVKSTGHVQSLSSIIVNRCELYDLSDCRSLIANRYCGRTLAKRILQQDIPFYVLNDRNKILHRITV